MTEKAQPHVYTWADICNLLNYHEDSAPDAVRDIRNALWNNPDCGGYRKARLWEVR